MPQSWLLALPALLAPPALAAQAAELYRLDGTNTEVSFDVRLFTVPWVSAHVAESDQGVEVGWLRGAWDLQLAASNGTAGERLRFVRWTQDRPYRLAGPGRADR